MNAKLIGHGHSPPESEQIPTEVGSLSVISPCYCKKNQSRHAEFYELKNGEGWKSYIIIAVGFSPLIQFLKADVYLW
jgi:hypothetical protein